MSISGPRVLRSGRLETKAESVISGLLTASSFFIALICIIITLREEKEHERTQKKNFFQIKCPSCKREKEISEYGKYKCTKCGQKFIVGSDGKISNIESEKYFRRG